MTGFVANLKTFHPDRLYRRLCLVKGDARVLARKVSSHLDFLEKFYLSLVALSVMFMWRGV
jgi:hypothetical protein